MIRFKIKEMMAKKEYELGRRLTIGEVAEATDIHRMTLSKMCLSYLLNNDRLLDATKVPTKKPKFACFNEHKPVQLSMNRLGTFSYDHRLRTGQHPGSAS